MKDGLCLSTVTLTTMMRVLLRPRWDISSRTCPTELRVVLLRMTPAPKSMICSITPIKRSRTRVRSVYPTAFSHYLHLLGIRCSVYTNDMHCTRLQVLFTMGIRSCGQCRQGAIFVGS